MYWLLFVGFFLLLGKGVEKAVTVTIGRKEFTSEIIKAALPVSKESGIPVSLIAAQAAHESNYGQSKLAREGFNLFGIKAGQDWIGPTIDIVTTEYIGREKIHPIAHWRKYSTYEASIRDWFKFLQRPRYSKALLYAKMGDARQFFVELQKAGYATDPTYADKLSRVFDSVKEATA